MRRERVRQPVHSLRLDPQLVQRVHYEEECTLRRHDLCPQLLRDRSHELGKLAQRHRHRLPVPLRNLATQASEQISQTARARRHADVARHHHRMRMRLGRVLDSLRQQRRFADPRCPCHHQWPHGLSSQICRHLCQFAFAPDHHRSERRGKLIIRPGCGIAHLRGLPTGERVPYPWFKQCKELLRQSVVARQGGLVRARSGRLVGYGIAPDLPLQAVFNLHLERLQVRPLLWRLRVQCLS